MDLIGYVLSFHHHNSDMLQYECCFNVNYYKQLELRENVTIQNIYEFI